MSRSIAWALATAALAVSTGCAYEFTDRYAMRDVKYREDAQGLLALHDLEKGSYLMIILRDQTPGLNVGTGETLKLNFEIREFKLGVPIDLETDKVMVRFSILQGMPVPHDGEMGTVAKGTITILKVTELGLLFECDMQIRMVELKGGDSSIEDVKLKYFCTWLPPDPDRLPPYLGGTLEDPRDAPMRDESKDKPK